MRGLTTLAFVLTSVHLNCFAQEAKSVHSGGKPVELMIENDTGIPLRVQWMNFEGESQDYGAVPVGQTIPYQSYPGYVWQFVSDEQVVGTYRTTQADRQTFTVSGGASAPVPIPGNAAGAGISGATSLPSAQGSGSGGFFKRLREKKQMKLARDTGAGTTVQGGAVSPDSGVSAETGSRMSSAEANQLIQYHNQVRAEVGVGKVTWSPEIASYAQEWADHLATVGKFEHRPSAQKKYGENLAAGSNPQYNVLRGAEGWYGEKPLYKKGAPFSMTFMPAAHYTQMVWRSSTLIGAATAVCTKGKYKGWTIVVCNYNPGGNMLGQPPY